MRIAPVVQAVLLAGAVVLSYAGVYGVPFYFDDQQTIGELRGKPVLETLRENPMRALAALSFHGNIAAGGGLAGLHAVNVGVHAANAILLWLLLGSALRLRAPGLPEWLPFAGALLWALHPVQTSAVTYLSQRIAGIAALCYLGAAACYLRAREAACGDLAAGRGAGSARGWYAAAIVFGLAAAASKENTATLPAGLVLCEWLLVGDRSRDPLARRALRLAPFCVTPLLQIAYLFHERAVAGAEQVRLGGAPGKKIYGYVAAYQGFDFPTRREYLLTEPGVLLRYLKLWFLPVNQVFDPLILPVRRVADPRFLMPAAALALLLGAALTQARRRPLVAFGVLWFLVTMSVESSVIPIADYFFEHRMLLPSAGLVTAMIGLAGPWAARRRRAAAALAAALALALGAATVARNRLWQDPILFWSDNVAKAPGKVRGWLNLSDAYAGEGRLDLAEDALVRARAIFDRADDVHYDLGVIRMRRGALGGAEEAFRRAIAIFPFHAEAHYNLGSLLARTGRYREAENEFRWVIRIKEAYVPEAHYNLGVLYRAQGRVPEAVRAFELAVKERPDLMEAHQNLAAIYQEQGRGPEAAREAAIAERLRREKGRR
jgi:tetratricopeptide (TPR) repeat protein